MPEVTLTTSGPPETILDLEPEDARQAIEEALALPEADRRAALAEIVARWPRCLDAWARLGDHGRDVIECYAAYRIGYHRGLDRLRANGWRGSGYVRWQHPSNQGFLRALAGLQRCAAAIAEHDEAERCAHFLRQLDPGWSPAELG